MTDRRPLLHRETSTNRCLRKSKMRSKCTLLTAMRSKPLGYFYYLRSFYPDSCILSSFYVVNIYMPSTLLHALVNLLFVLVLPFNTVLSGIHVGLHFLHLDVSYFVDRLLPFAFSPRCCHYATSISSHIYQLYCQRNINYVPEEHKTARQLFSLLNPFQVCYPQCQTEGRKRSYHCISFQTTVLSTEHEEKNTRAVKEDKQLIMVVTG